MQAGGPNAGSFPPQSFGGPSGFGPPGPHQPPGMFGALQPAQQFDYSHGKTLLTRSFVASPASQAGTCWHSVYHTVW